MSQPSAAHDPSLTGQNDDDDDEEELLRELMKRMGLPQAFSSSKRTKASSPDPAPSTSSPSPSDGQSSPSSSTSTASQRKKKQPRRKQTSSFTGSHHVDWYDNPSHIARWAPTLSRSSDSADDGEAARPLIEEKTGDAVEGDEEMQDAAVVRPLLPVAAAAEAKESADLSATEEVASPEAAPQPPQPVVEQTPSVSQAATQTESEAREPATLTTATDDASAEGMEEGEVEEEGQGDVEDGADDAPSLYPSGFARFADRGDAAATADEAEEEGDHRAEGLETDAADIADPSSLPPEAQGSEEEEEELLDDYGLLQGEVLEGEDCTHHEPVDVDHHYRGLPTGLTRRVVLPDDPTPLPVLPPTPVLLSAVEVDADGRVQPYPEREKKPETTAAPTDDEAPLELPSNLPIPLPLPPLPPPAASSASSASDATLPSVLPTLPPLTFPASADSQRWPPPREEPRAFEGEVVEGIDATFLPPDSGPTELRGLPRQNRRVVFSDSPSDDGTVVTDARLPVPSSPPRSNSDALPEDTDAVSVASPLPSSEDEDLEAMFPSPRLPYPVDCSASAVHADPNMSESVDVKYFAQRYRLFSLYDRGCRLDSTAWYSVTPERIALHQAHRIVTAFPPSHPPLTVIDAFAGVGGNAIAFARHPRVGRVVAVEVDAGRLAMARANAEVYGVAGKVEWVEGRWEEVKGGIRGDVVFLAPPWGGVGYRERVTYGLGEVAVEGGGRGLYEGCQEVVGERGAVALNLPRNVDEAEVVALGRGEAVEVEYNQCNSKVKTITAYFGALVRKRPAVVL